MGQLEAIKENIVRAKSGRSAKGLAELAAAAAGGVETRLADERAALEAAIGATADGADPLAAHWRLLAWLRRAHPAGPPPKLYAKALETAARAFRFALRVFLSAPKSPPRKDRRYTNDARFVSIWVQVATRAPEPEDVFKYLQANSIGQASALFYEEYAGLLETRGRYKEADAIYSLGIARAADPLDNLQSKYNSFQHRMMMPQPKPSSTPDYPHLDSETKFDGADGGTLDSGIVRPALGQPASHNHFKSATSFTSYTSFGSTAMSSQLPISNSAPVKLSVFKDNASTTNEAALVTAAGEEGTKWADFGTIASQTKENVLAPEKWTSARIPQQRQHQTVPQAARLQVYVDDESVTYLKSSSKTDPSKNILMPSIPSDDASKAIISLLSEQESLPAAESEITQQTPKIQQPSTILRPKTPPVILPNVSQKECFVSDIRKIYRDDKEFSFEEIRAQYEESVAAIKAASAVPNSPNLLCEESMDMTVISSESDDDSQHGIELERLKKLNAVSAHENSSIQKNPPHPPPILVPNIKKSSMVASPTINTKAALADVYEMFNAKLPHEKLQLPKVNQMLQIQELMNNEEGEEEEEEEDLDLNVKHNLETKPEWYEIEADETISKQVYQPAPVAIKLKKSIFVDNENPVVQTSIKVFNDEPLIAEDKENAPVLAKRKPLGSKPIIPKQAPHSMPTPTPVVDPQSPFLEDTTARKNQPDSSTSPVTRIAGATVLQQNSISSGSPERLTVEFLHSTPAPISTQSPMDGVTSEDSSLSEDSLISKLQNHEPNFRDQAITQARIFNSGNSISNFHSSQLSHHHLPDMTPIPEASFEIDSSMRMSTMTGFSSISNNSRNMRFGSSMTRSSNASGFTFGTQQSGDSSINGVGESVDVTGTWRASLGEIPETVLPKSGKIGVLVMKELQNSEHDKEGEEGETGQRSHKEYDDNEADETMFGESYGARRFNSGINSVLGERDDEVENPIDFAQGKDEAQNKLVEEAVVEQENELEQG
ncbi:hypothetical protein HK100_004491, partial [Physocladia obscura]